MRLSLRCISVEENHLSSSSLRRSTPCFYQFAVHFFPFGYLLPITVPVEEDEIEEGTGVAEGGGACCLHWRVGSTVTWQRREGEGEGERVCTRTLACSCTHAPTTMRACKWSGRCIRARQTSTRAPFDCKLAVINTVCVRFVMALACDNMFLLFL